jgi:hypothetical protein
MRYIICKNDRKKIYTAKEKLDILRQVFPEYKVVKSEGGSEEHDGAGNLIANWHWFNLLKDGEVCKHILFEGNGECVEYGEFIVDGEKRRFVIKEEFV